MSVPCPSLDVGCAPWAECYVEGVLPCSSTLSGNVFLFLVYGFVMYLGAKITYDYSHKLLEFVPVSSPSVRVLVGVINPVLSVLPVVAVIAACAFGGGQLELQQKRMNVGMGALAGSTMFSITIGWATLLLLGRCDIRTGDMIDGELSDPKDFFGTGVSPDKNTRLQAALMGAAVLAYCIVQASAFATIGEDLTSMTHAQTPFILITCIAAALLFALYLGLQQWDRHIFERRVREAQNKKLVKDVIATFVTNVTHAPNMTAAALADRNESYDWMAAVEQEHLAQQEERLLNVGGVVYCASLLVCGVVLVAVSAYPLVQSIMTFCERIGINAPELYVAYIVVPVVCNGNAYIALFLDASYKKKKTVSQSFSYLFGMVTLYSTCGLMVFTAILYSNGLVWTWSTEAMLMIAIVLIMGVMSGLMTIYKSFWAAFASILYVVALLFVLLLNSSFL